VCGGAVALLHPASSAAVVAVPAPARNDRREILFLIEVSIFFTIYLSSVQVADSTFTEITQERRVWM
jgi:hypothetical protein